MNTTFYIKFTFRTPKGFESYGQFFIGNDRSVAKSIFEELHGNNKIDENNVLQLDFIETNNNLPVNIQVLRCTLNEMAENCKIITKELFKKKLLNE